MSTEREVTGLVRSWLEDGITTLPDRVLDDVLDRLPQTRQRRSWWPPRRFTDMNTYAKLGIAAAAVVVVAVVGINLLPASGDVGGGGPAVTPSPAPTVTPSPAPTVTPSPTPASFVIPPAGPLAIGRHDLTMDGVPFSMEFPTSGWISNGDFGIDKRSDTEPGGDFIIWGSSADGVFTDPCKGVEGPRVGSTAADIAEAMANVPGTEATGPSDVTVGGYPAKLIVVKVPEVLPCNPIDFYLWWDEKLTGRYATDVGVTIKVWIVDVNGTLVQLDGETFKETSPEIEQEMQQIIDSIEFE